ncbi:hypothetical protein RHMOL_Rhmol01G0054100 [Rhododendron molle]|uniref:Uncharacterized protein n=1 Tax=Rhododendron molle TaxID=49168 RepID=A0ACC0PYX9_RHOML|nr:hypothetical protein RHMOL_Rhmol01G0054100 [Rhododendron molle]
MSVTFWRRGLHGLVPLSQMCALRIPVSTLAPTCSTHDCNFNNHRKNDIQAQTQKL